MAERAAPDVAAESLPCLWMTNLLQPVHDLLYFFWLVSTARAGVRLKFIHLTGFGVVALKQAWRHMHAFASDAARLISWRQLSAVTVSQSGEYVIIRAVMQTHGMSDD